MTNLLGNPHFIIQQYDNKQIEIFLIAQFGGTIAGLARCESAFSYVTGTYNLKKIDLIITLFCENGYFPENKNASNRYYFLLEGSDFEIGETIKGNCILYRHASGWSSIKKIEECFAEG